MINVNFKPVKDSTDVFVNLSNGWTRKCTADELPKFLFMYLSSPEYTVFVDEFTDGLISQYSNLLQVPDNMTMDKALKALKNYQYEKYTISLINFSNI